MDSQIDCNRRALVAMSGGVDSSVAAALMCEEGYDCIGVTMKLYNGNEQPGVKACCSLSDTEDARSVAFRLGMKYRVFNYVHEFESCVIKNFVDEYVRGRTPNPCIDCNRFLKFGELYTRAQILGCDTVVTGHYARVEYDSDSGLWQLRRAENKVKDQSYVLYFLTQKQLAHTRFPLGRFSDKKQVRALADAYGFVNAEKADSQDICFVQNGSFGDFIEDYIGTGSSGNFVGTDGRILGRHSGIYRYTKGQRRGLGVSSDKPLYVCGKCVQDNTVILSGEEELYSKSLKASDFNWISGTAPDGWTEVQAKTRYNSNPCAAIARSMPDGVVEVVFNQPQRAVTEGQAVVLYNGDVVLGGGTIDEVS